MVVVGLAAVAALAVLGAELRAAGRVVKTLEAQALAEYRLAEARLLSDAELARLRGQSVEGRFAPPFEEYTWALVIHPVPGEPGLREAQVRVAWGTGEVVLGSRFRSPTIQVAP